MQWICDTVNWLREANEEETINRYDSPKLSAPPSARSTRKRYDRNDF